MNEKYVEALEQYDMEVRAVRKGRGSWICETDQGCRLLKEYRGTARRLEFEDEVLGRLDTRGSLRADRYLRNREGGLMTVTGDGTRYILKDWFLDRECNIKDGYEIRQALSRLAMLHSQLRKIEFKEEWNMGSILIEPLETELERHNRELQRARNYIRSKRKKTEFELCVIGSYQMFYDQALEAVQGIRELWPGADELPSEGTAQNNTGKYLKLGPYQEDQDALEAAEVQPPVKKDRKPLYLCHGDLDQHHVLMGGSYTAIIEYNRMHLGIQISDLYRFMRKVMEKHNWNVDLGRSMMDAYERVLDMGSKEMRCLYYMFLYPEKYWKQINFYYNANKAWIPARNIEKLRSLEEQQPVRNRFLEQIFAGI